MTGQVARDRQRQTGPGGGESPAPTDQRPEHGGLGGMIFRERHPFDREAIQKPQLVRGSWNTNSTATTPRLSWGEEAIRIASRGTLGVDYGFGRRFSVGLGIGDLAVLFEDSKRDDEHSPTFAAQLGGQIHLDRVTLLNVGLDHSTEYTTPRRRALLSPRLNS